MRLDTDLIGKTLEVVYVTNSTQVSFSVKKYLCALWQISCVKKKKGGIYYQNKKKRDLVLILFGIADD